MDIHVIYRACRACHPEALKHDAYRLHSTECDAGADRQIECTADGLRRRLQSARTAGASSALLESGRPASARLPTLAAADLAGRADGVQRHLLGVQGVSRATSPGAHPP